MGLTFKNYQQNALSALESFFAKARGSITEQQTAQAFLAARREALGDAAPKSIYRRFAPDHSEVPQVCIRIPTGGGKTLLAAHAIERAARLYVGTQYPLALWLVPSNTIRNQTIEALQKPGHPYRRALEQHFAADRLTVIDIEDCDQLRPDDFEGRTIVIVGTLQTLRVGNTASRKIYAYKESFEAHFAKLPLDTTYFERVKENDLIEQPYLKQADLGRVKFSFANLLAWYRPIVIVDEAHNNGTPLSTETLVRIRPACIIEWTATPAEEQNILYTVSAQELKAEHMIKLPIVLSPHGSWQEALRDAVLTRDRLAKEATQEKEYIRPIVLFQADSKNGELPVDKLKAHLLEVLHIEERRIAVATGDQRELDGVNLFDPACRIDFVITVEALKEGWDCSFAYVFATVQNVRSAKDMEQLLGRVLRLPYAARRQSEHLNRAYAHVSAPATYDTANQLADHLISMGFEEFEAVSAVTPAGPDLFGDSLPGQSHPQRVQTRLELPKRAAEELLHKSDGTVAIEREGEKFIVVVTGIVPQEAIEAAVATLPQAKQEAIHRDLKHHQARALKAASPKDRGAHLPPVPQLAIPLQGELVLFEPAILGDIANFSLAGRDAVLDFAEKNDAPAYLIDVDGERVRIATESLANQLDLNIDSGVIRREDVIRALDRKLHRHDILQPDMIAWLGRAIDDLTRRGIDLTYLARHVNYLADALKAKITILASKATREACQLILGDPARKPRLDDHFVFHFPEDNYPAKYRYDGRYVFQKHFFGPPGDLDADTNSEETSCAIAIDQLQEVKHWVRNLERQPNSSFWLPTSTDRFYPDFVAELTNGRLFVVEYKGAHLYTGDDAREKRDIGNLWAAASGYKCRFTMVTAESAANGKSLKEQLHAAAT
jgi:type III restriction enzyme